MNINKLIRNSCIKTFAFLGLICFLVILIFYSLFMEKIKLVEGEAFIEDTEELFPYIQDFASSFSYESLDKVIEKNQSLDLGFCIRKTDGTPIWLSEAALEFKSNSDSHIKGFIFLGAGFSEKDYYRLQECAAWRQTINDTTYQYEIFGKNLVRGDGFFYIPGIIEITSYIVEEPLNLNSDLKKLPEIEIIEINNTTNKINASEEQTFYSGTISSAELFPNNDSMLFADSIHRFETLSPTAEAEINKNKWICQDSILLKKVFISASPVKAMYYGEAVDAVIIFAKYIDLGKVYGSSLFIMLLTGITLFAITGIIICINIKKSLTAMYTSEQDRRLMVNSIAHDLKTPTAAISVYAELLKDEDFSENKVLYADKIIKNSELLVTQLQNISVFSKIDSPSFKLKYETFDLKELTEDIISGFEHDSAFSSISLDGKCTPIHADKRLLGMTIENFISNALKNVSDRNKKILITIDEGSWSIYNTGNHINEKNLNKIWDAWFVEDEGGRSSGSGLGLFIAKTILDAHNITYHAKNMEDGVIFSFNFTHLTLSLNNTPPCV